MREKSIRQIAAEAGIPRQIGVQMDRGSREVSDLRREELRRDEHTRMQRFMDDVIEQWTGLRVGMGEMTKGDLGRAERARA